MKKFVKKFSNNKLQKKWSWLLQMIMNAIPNQFDKNQNGLLWECITLTVTIMKGLIALIENEIL